MQIQWHQQKFMLLWLYLFIVAQIAQVDWPI